MQDEQVNRDGQPENQLAQPGTSPTSHVTSGPPPHRSSWPIVLGIVAIVFGAAGFLGNLWATAAPFVMDQIMSSMTGQMGGEAEETFRATMEITRAWRSWSVVFGLAGVVVSGLLLVGGIQLLMRRAAALQLLRAWALVRMVMVVVGAYVAFRIQQQTFGALRSTMGAEMDQVPAGLLGATAMFGTVFSLLFGWALPVFFLIWFARQAIKDEVAGWM